MADEQRAGKATPVPVLLRRFYDRIMSDGGTEEEWALLRAVQDAEEALRPFARMGDLAAFYIEEACPGMCWPAGGKTDPDGPPSQAVGTHEMIFARRAHGLVNFKADQQQQDQA